MDATTLANEIRVRCKPEHVHKFLGKSDAEVIEQSVHCPDCEEPLVHLERLPAIVNRSHDLRSFGENIVGAHTVGFFSEAEQDVLEDFLNIAVKRGVEAIIGYRGIGPVEPDVYDAFIAEGSFFAKSFFRNADN